MTSVASQEGHLAARGFSIPRKRRSIDTKSEAGMIRAGSTGLALKQATAPGLDRLRCRALARHLVSIHPNTSFEPDGPASSGSWSREATYRWYRTRVTCCPSMCCALWKLIVSPSLPPHQTAMKLFPRSRGTPCSASFPGPRPALLPRTPHGCREGPWRYNICGERSELGSSLRTFPPNGLERSARTYGTVATKLPMDAGILLDLADRPTPPAPVQRLACAFWWSCSVNRFAGHPSSKNDDSSAVPGSSRRRSSRHILG